MATSAGEKFSPVGFQGLRGRRQPESRAIQSARGRQTAVDFVADVLRFRESLQLKISGGLTASRALSGSQFSLPPGEPGEVHRSP